MTTWSTGQKPNVAEACDYCTAGKATFIISDELFGVIGKLCADVKTEWQMLLTGTELEDNVVKFTGYHIPKQKVTSATVTNEECLDQEEITRLGVIATLHSHSDMGVFFSSVDYTHTNTSFIKNHMVVNNKGEYVGTKAIVLPCGMTKFIDANVTRDMPAIVQATEVVGIDNIEKFTPTYTPMAYNSSWVDEDWIKGNGKRKLHSFDFEEGGNNGKNRKV